MKNGGHWPPFSFLRGASDAVDLALCARALGYDALGIADANSMAGVVRLHCAGRLRAFSRVIPSHGSSSAA